MALVVGDDSKGRIVKAVASQNKNNPNNGKIMGTYYTTKDNSGNTQYVKPTTRAEYDTLKGITKDEPEEEKQIIEETNTDTELGNALASWFQSMKTKNDEYYDKAQNASDLQYNKLRRAYVAQNARNKAKMKGEYAKIGMNPSHSSAWDMDYATSKNLGDLEISRAQDDASIAKNRYDSNNTLVSNMLSSGLSNNALVKALKGII